MKQGVRCKLPGERSGQRGAGSPAWDTADKLELSGESVEQRVDEESPSSAPKEDGRRKKRGVKEVLDWEGDLQSLLELGERLDLSTTLNRQWRPGAKAEEFCGLTCRDAWIEDYLKIRMKKGGRTSFKLNGVQREYSRTCGKQNIVLKARQLGITSYIAARLFVQTVTRKGTLTMLVAHDRLAAEEIFRIVHRFWDNLPAKLQKGALKTSHSSARELVFPRLDSEFTVAAADDNAGRGRTIQNLHCSEVSRWGRKGEDALASLRAAVVPGGEIVLESTANGAWGSFYQEWQQAEETGYKRHFFPWWFEESYKSVVGPSFEMTVEEAELAAANGLSAEQIAWRRQQWATLRGLAGQEFAEDAVACFRASGECVFELETLEQMMREGSEPVEVRDNGRLTIWLPPRQGRNYVIGVDPAGGGVGGDYCCAQVIDLELGAQCAELHGHYPQKELAMKVAKLGKAYNTALLAVERNNHGFGVLAHLETMNYPKIFAEKNQAGWYTSVHSRPMMIANMAAVLEDAPGLFKSERLLNECRTFVRDRDGSPRGAPGTHDDSVMAMAIALIVRKIVAGESEEKRRSKMEYDETEQFECAGVTGGGGWEG